MKVLNVVGARPNFMKIAPIIEEMEKYSEIEPILVHTGQHYDENMSKLFFEDLQLPEPDIYLGVGSGSHAEQTAKIILRFERVLLKENPDLVVVVGDVNSTVACALTAAKLQIPVAHVEAGLRSFDRTMPEEINRLLTDAISDYLFTTEPSAERNLLREGIDKKKIHFVGNVMIDTLLKNKEKAASSSILEKLGLSPQTYAVLTLHRPSNVDDKETFKRILEALREIGKHIKIVYPIHPRARKTLESFNLLQSTNGFKIIEPLGYLDFLKLMMHSKLVITDSGGMQEETTILDMPCVTIRKNTERPITVEQGSNVVVGTDKENIIAESMKAINGSRNGRTLPELWDGKAAERIVKIIVYELIGTARGQLSSFPLFERPKT